ncbi:MAG: hypothetical protein M1822_007006 [Bathelium mastoideum]|nr:MAG: hypothetical protein M1822_007006 [Bathelium mastoideum]
MASSAEPKPSSKGDGAPDIMNDPAYATNAQKSDKSPEDPDTCRICRGEGTEDEPLFYPCKCSGSIKFVHQDCLMEWLSHSQKKHCELCKTPFRFTKLYSPHMPDSIPTTVFLHRAAIHCLRQFMAWCRGLLVVSVWLFWLPWCMRFVWRGLFWVGDGGWARDLTAITPINLSAARRRHNLTEFITEMIENYNKSGMAANNDTIRTIHPGLAESIIAPVFRMLNFTTAEPVGLSLSKHLFARSSLSSRNETNATSSRPSNDRLAAQIQPSLLSDIPLFSSLTPSPTINRLILDVLEGQIITLLVLVAFILIFLIREWVVQQQPVINMAAMNAQNARRGPQQRVGADEDAQGQEHEIHGRVPPVPPNSDATSEVHVEVNHGHDVRAESSNTGRLEDQDPSIIHSGASEGQLNGAMQATPERSSIGRAEWSGSDERQENLGIPDEHSSKTQSESVESEGSNNSLHPNASARSRPQMPSRDQSFMATAVRRELEESGGARNPGKAPDNSKNDDGVNENESENSSESWQHLSGSDDEKLAASQNRADPRENDASTRAPLSTRAKGKNKVANVSDETEHAAIPSDSHDQHNRDETQSTASDRQHTHTAGPTTNPFNPDFEDGLPENLNPVPDLTQGDNHDTEPDTQHTQPEIANAKVSWSERLLDWLWGDAAPADPEAQPAGPDEEQLLEEGDNDQQENFIHVIDGQPAPHVHNHEDGDAQDPEVVAAAQQAGIDPDPAAADDAEDLEGIMELIGMQGPWTGLVQNAMFGAFLISATVAGAVWFPYLFGKLVILFIGSPISLLQLPITIISGTTDLIADTCLFFGGSLIHWGMKATRILFLALGWGIPVFASDYEVFNTIATYGRAVGEHALDRIAFLFVSTGISFHADYLQLSLKSHAALQGMQNELRAILSFFLAAVVATCRNLADLGVVETLRQIRLQIPNLFFGFVDAVTAWSHEVVHSSLIFLQSLISTSPVEPAIDPTPLDPSLAYWGAWDRLLAVFAGYGFFAIAGAIYLRRGAFFTTSQQGRKIEGIITEVLQQAGGVMKVIFIISIEMIVFPLYCGILLDVALLPLCEDATVLSRVDWTLQSPWTSGFVHWFIGTCYMFHFALFVSMCRKVMRNGVLYFIRDPDDPTFHPVRDVLERSVSTQLRKITFSALVYGGLVIVGLGGVVWSLPYFFDQVLPIRWSANEPFFEFPIDLLLYNFLTPVILKALQPSQALHTMYEWWFRRCARLLRLSHFLFGERQADEEGRYVYESWVGFLTLNKDAIEAPVIGKDGTIHLNYEQTDGHFLKDGRYVRAPASDQVRIPKDRDVFLGVDENNKRLDGLPEDANGIHGRENDQFEKVYIPPWFRGRIGLFIVCLWVFAAVTGIGLTIVPLVFGRLVFSMCLDDATRINDIYAFCFGLYVLGGIGYLATKAKATFNAIKAHLKERNVISSETMQQIKFYAIRTAKVIYTYSAFIILVPCIFALILELYLVLPLHSYIQLGHRAAAATTGTTTTNRPPSPSPSLNGSSAALNTSTLLPTSPNLFDSRHFAQSLMGTMPANHPSSQLPPLLAPHVLHLLQSWTLGLLYFRITLRILLSLPTARAARALRAVVRRGWWDPDVALATRGFVLPLLVLAALVVAGPPAVVGLCVNAWAWSARGMRWWWGDGDRIAVVARKYVRAGRGGREVRALTQDREAMALLYRFSYPVALAVGMGVWGAVGVVRALARWRRMIRDEVYLVGERLHNFGEAKAAGLGSSGRRGSAEGSESGDVEAGQPRLGVELPRAEQAGA